MPFEHVGVKIVGSNGVAETERKDDCSLSFGRHPSELFVTFVAGPP